jgi:MinD-like ATPase involved in chromosome partitioning or flagellar assembly
MLVMVQRNLAGKATPVVAIVGLDGQDSTEHVTAALGMLFAEQAPHAVLLIEANPKRSLSQRYGALQSTGLSELLAGRVERSAAILPTSHERLDLLAFGLATQEQSQLLPPALSAALQNVRSTQAAAVIDAGPLSSPWALPASQAADAVYLVVRVGDTSAEYATGCVERFRAAGGKLTGCIAVGPLPA